MRTGKLSESFMLGMWKLGFKTCFVLKGHKEAMGEAIVLTFRADVRAPFVADDGVHFFGKVAEGILNDFDLVFGSAIFEFEEDNMAVRAISGLNLRSGHKGHECHERKNEQVFHVPKHADRQREVNDGSIA